MAEIRPFRMAIGGDVGDLRVAKAALVSLLKHTGELALVRRRRVRPTIESDPG
jgi:hypothetical protein